MKKLLKRFSVILIAVVLAVMATGCSNPVSTVTTTINLNSDGSGERIMRIDIHRVDFNDNFNGTFEDLTKLIDEKKQDFLEYTTKDDEEDFYIIFTMKFSSIDDYNTKMDKLVPDRTDSQKLYFEKPDSLWQSGVYVSENLSGDLPFAWLEDAIVEAGYVAEGDKGYILGPTNATSLTLDGEELTSNFYSYYDTRCTFYVSQIEMQTEVNTMNDFTKNYTFYLTTNSWSHSIVEQDKAPYEQYFKEMAGEGANVSSDDTKIFISFENVSANTIAKADAKLFADSAFSVEYVKDAEKLFECEYSIKEKYDASNYFNENLNNSLSLYSRYNFLNGFRTTSSNSTGSYLTKANSVFENELVCRVDYNLKEIRVEALAKSENDIQMTFKFKLGNTLSQEEQDGLANRIEATMDKATADFEDSDKDFEALFEGEGKTEKYEGTITFSGDADVVSEGLKRITGKDALVKFSSDKGLLKPKYDKKVTLEVNLSNFSRYISSDEFKAKATVDFGTGAEVYKCSADKADIDKTSVTFDLSRNSNSVTMKAECSNAMAVILIIVIIAAVAVVIAVVILSVLKKKKKTAVVPASQAASDTKAKTCPKCGKEVASDTSFCANCGANVQ